MSTTTVTQTPATNPHIVDTYDPRRRWAGLAVLGFALLAIVSDMTILNVAIPAMSADLQPTTSEQLWIIDAYSLVLAGLLITMSSLGDRFGRRRLLLLGYAIIALASVLVLFSQSAGYVIALRLLLGVGGAMVMPATLSLIRVTFSDPRERASALAVWAAVAGIGAAVGPLLGGFLLSHFHWHAAFLVSLPMMVIAFVGSLFLVPESKVPEPGPWDLLAAALSLVGMASTVWAVKKFGETASLTYFPAWIALALGLVALSWFVVRCNHSSSPLIDMSMFRHRIFSAGVLSCLIASMSMSAGLYLLAQWLQLVNGSTALESGWQLMPLAVSAAIVSLLAPLLAGAIGMRITVFSGLLVSGAGMLYLGWAGADMALPDVYIALVLVGIGIGSLALASAMIMGGVPRSKAGNAAAMEDTAYEFGAVLGISLLGSLSAMMYRSELGTEQLARTLGPELTHVAEDSLGGAMAVATELGLPELAERAGRAFSSGLGVTGLVGGIAMIVAAVAVFWLTPAGTRLENLEH